MQDTLYYIRKLYDIGHPAPAWCVVLPIRRPDVLDPDTEEEMPHPNGWIYHIN